MTIRLAFIFIFTIGVVTGSYADNHEWKIDSILEKPTCLTYGSMKVINDVGDTVFTILPKLAHQYIEREACKMCKTNWFEDVRPYSGKPAIDIVTLSEDNYKDYGFTELNWNQKVGHYVISNADEFVAYLKMYASGGDTADIKRSAFLTDDILFISEIDLPVCNIPIGVVFDGMGHSIKGLSCCASALFNNNEGTVANLGLASPSFTSDAKDSYIGFFVNTNKGAVENCFVFQGVLSTTSATTKVGGIVGRNLANGSVANCYCTANTTKVAAEDYNIFSSKSFLADSVSHEQITGSAFLAMLNSGGHGKCIPWCIPQHISCKCIPTLTGSTRFTSPMQYYQRIPSTCTAEGVIEHYTCEWCGMNFSRDDHAMSSEYINIIKVPHELVKHDAVNKIKSCLVPHPAEYWQCEVCLSYFDDKFHPFEWVEPHDHSMIHIPYHTDCVCGGYQEHWECIDCRNWFTDSDPATDDNMASDSSLYIKPSALDWGEIFNMYLYDENQIQTPDEYICTSSYVERKWWCSEVTVRATLYANNRHDEVYKVEVFKNSKLIGSGTINNSISWTYYNNRCLIEIPSTARGDTITIKIHSGRLRDNYILVDATAKRRGVHDILTEGKPGDLIGACHKCTYTESPYIYHGIGDKDIPLTGNSSEGFISTIPIELDDKTTYNSEVGFCAPVVMFSRNSDNANEWNPLNLPFDFVVDNDVLANCELATVEGVSCIDDNGYILGDDNYPNDRLGILISKVKPGSTISLLYPFVVRPKEKGINLILSNAYMASSEEVFSKNFSINNIIKETNYIFYSCYGKKTLDTYWYLLSNNERFLPYSGLSEQYFWYLNLQGANLDVADKLLKEAMIIEIDNPYGDDDDNPPTIIDGVQTNKKTDILHIYNLQGQKVTTMQKGQIYIVNGKKIYNK